jgi:hypothetical protein
MPDAALLEHRRVINRIFAEAAVVVEQHVTGQRKAAIEADLASLFEYRKRYYVPPEDGETV